jgi:CubicO group peptidase (beta-lactamase class C family)
VLRISGQCNLLQRNAFGIAATIVLNGLVAYQRGFGTVSLTSAQAIQSTTRFRVGSITKMMPTGIQLPARPPVAIAIVAAF